MKRLLIIALFLFVFVIFPSQVKAAVLINEISPSTDPEWVELYNDGDLAVDLSGFLIEDGNSSHTDDLPITGSIAAKGYLVFNHAEGWLNNSGDTVKLYNNSSTIIDQYTYGNIDSSHSIIRSPDGSENWVVTASVTNGTSNPVPTPSPTNSPTPSPTQTSMSTSTPAVTLTPIPTKTPSPTPKSTKSPSPTPSPSEGSSSIPDVLSASDAPTSTPDGVKVKGASKINRSLFSYILIGSGIVMIGFSIWHIIKNRNAQKDSLLP